MILLLASRWQVSSMAFADVLLVKSVLILTHKYAVLGCSVVITWFLVWLAQFVYGNKTRLLGRRGGKKDVQSRERMRESVAFLSDDEMSGSIVYRATKLFMYHFWGWFHDFELRGLENLPAGKGALIISMHTTHNMDIFMGVTGIHELTGRAPRGLLHRVLFEFFPSVRYVGMVPGSRGTAVQLLKEGFLCCVLPGGAEEAMCGHENAYRLHPRWDDRRGYVHVAKEAGVDVVPVFLQNAEEMRFNVFFFLANKVGFTRRYQELVDLNIPCVSWCLKQLGMVVWFSLVCTAIPVPVKTTAFFGEPIRTEDSVDDIAGRCRKALDELIAQHQPHGHAYMPGLRQRFDRQKAA